MNVPEISFGQPTEDNGYNPFSEPLADWDSLLFHGTSETSADSILGNGFRPNKLLQSSSFVRSRGVGVALQYACQKRHGARGAVLAVLFQDLNASGIREEGDVVYLDNHQMQPQIVAVCYVPKDYDHV